MLRLLIGLGNQNSELESLIGFTSQNKVANQNQNRGTCHNLRTRNKRLGVGLSIGGTNDAQYRAPHPYRHCPWCILHYGDPELPLLLRVHPILKIDHFALYKILKYPF